MRLQEFLQRSAKSPSFQHPTRILGLDPGGTTGYSFIEVTPDYQVELIDADQFSSSFSELDYLFERYVPDITVVESFRLYPWKANDQAWSSMLTPRFIGAIEYVIWKHGHWVAFQSASQGKQFCNNDRLREWDLYQTKKKHANDAIRHICQYLIFGKDIKLERLDGNHFHDGE